MSLAWGSLVLLILLLPGFLFFVGLSLPEQFARETAERSALGQLAAVLLIAFGIHGLLYVILGGNCHSTIPCIRLEHVFTSLTLETRPAGLLAISRIIQKYRVWIFLYVFLACGLGVLSGYITGKLVVSGYLKGLIQHTWIYDLSVSDNFTVVYVMTHVRQDDRVLMYQGFLKAFGLQKDGRFSYVILTDAMRGYMHLSSHQPTTSAKDAWVRIGGSGLTIPGLDAVEAEYTRKDRSYFAIEGEDIANIVFDRLQFDYEAAAHDFDSLFARVVSEQDQAKAKVEG